MVVCPALALLALGAPASLMARLSVESAHMATEEMALHAQILMSVKRSQMPATYKMESTAV